MFNWFKVLWNLTDEKLLELNGADYTLYLVFLRQTAKFFAVISIYNAIFMVPMFVSGTAAPNPLKPTIMNTITVINVTNNPGKMMFTYFSSLLLISGFGFTLIFKYRQKYESWRKKLDPSVEFKSDTDLANYSIMVRNIPLN